MNSAPRINSQSNTRSSASASSSRTARANAFAHDGAVANDVVPFRVVARARSDARSSPSRSARSLRLHLTRFARASRIRDSQIASDRWRSKYRCRRSTFACDAMRSSSPECDDNRAMARAIASIASIGLVRSVGQGGHGGRSVREVGRSDSRSDGQSVGRSDTRTIGRTDTRSIGRGVIRVIDESSTS